MVGVCTGNMASLRKWFRGLTCGSRSCGGEEAGCFGGGSQHGYYFVVFSDLQDLSGQVKIYVLKKVTEEAPKAFDEFDGNEREKNTASGSCTIRP
jgi:hypothetical protein